MKRKLALLLTLLLTLSLVNFIPAAASAEILSEEFGDFVVTYHSTELIEASYDSETQVLFLKQSALSTSRVTCEVSMKEGLTAASPCGIQAEGEIYITLKNVITSGALSIAAGSDVTLEPQGICDFDRINTSAALQTPAALTISASHAQGNNKLRISGNGKIMLDNVSLTIDGGTLNVVHSINCSAFNMKSGTAVVKNGIYCSSFYLQGGTIEAAHIESSDIHLSGGSITVSSLTNPAFSSAPSLEYPSGYYWYASDTIGIIEAMKDSADEVYTYSSAHRYVKLIASFGIITVTGSGYEHTETETWISGSAVVNMSMDKDILFAVPHLVRLFAGERTLSIVNGSSLRLKSLDADNSIIEAQDYSNTKLILTFGNLLEGTQGTSAVLLGDHSQLSIGMYVEEVVSPDAKTAGAQAGASPYSGTLTINAAGAGFDGTGKLILNNLPLTITSGTGKAFGSLTDVELNYPNGYIWRASKTGGMGTYHNSSDAPFVLDDYTYVEILPIIPDMFEGADGYIFRTYEDWLREQAEKDLMAPPSGLQPDPTTEPEDLFAD